MKKLITLMLVACTMYAIGQTPKSAPYVNVVILNNGGYGPPTPSSSVSLTGIQMLLDNTATQYGQWIPTEREDHVYEGCQIPANFYDVFSHKIPANADPACNTRNAVEPGTPRTGQIPPGVYDYAMVYLRASEWHPGIFIMTAFDYPTGSGAFLGKGKGFVFEEHKKYTFEVFTLPSMATPIRMTIEDDAYPWAPAAASNLTVTPNSAGGNTVVVSWTNPSQLFGGGALTNLTSVSVYLNDETTPVWTNSSPVVGGAESQTITVPATGFYRITVIAYNSGDRGMPARSEEMWIGTDVPTAPTNVVLAENNLVANVSWTAPTTGLNGAFFNQTGLVYDVYRLPADVLISSNQTATTYTETIAQPGNIRYRIVAKNASGEGGFATSNAVVVCPPKIAQFPWKEGFEDNGNNLPHCWTQEYVVLTQGVPMDWTVLPNEAHSLLEYNPGTANSGRFRAVIPASGGNGHVGSRTKLIMPAFDLTSLDNPVLSFYHVQRAFMGENDILRVYYKTSATGEWTLLRTFDATVHDWTQHTFLLPNPSADYHIAFEGEYFYNERIMLDDIFVGEGDASVDGAAYKLYTAHAPMVGQPFVFKAAIENLSALPMTDYVVKLIDNQNNVLATSTIVGEIAAFSQEFANILYTPTTVGELQVRAVLELPGDINPANDTTPAITVNVLPNTPVFTSTIGTGTGWNTNNDLVELPFDFSWAGHRGQSLYFDHELIGRPAMITQVQYNYFGDGYVHEDGTSAGPIVIGERIQLYMANTNLNQLDDFIPDENFVLVYDGLLTMLEGQNTATLQLNQAFAYDGQNLVIMSYRPEGRAYHAHVWRNYWHITRTPDFHNRSIAQRYFVSSSGDHIDNPPHWERGRHVNFHPSTKLTMGFEASSLSGTVTSDGTTPVEGALVEILGASQQRLTDANGNYSFDFIAPGSYRVAASKHGYFSDTSAMQTFVLNQTSTVNLNIAHLPEFTLSGTVTSNDFPSGLEGVEVTLSGYDMVYTGTTDATGFYSIPSIFGMKTYDLVASKPNYQTYRSSVTMNDNMTYNFVCNQILTPPGRVLAMEQGDNAVVTWHRPGTFTQTSYILDNGVAEDGFYIRSGFNAALGNMFILDGQSGEISSVDVFGLESMFHDTDKPVLVEIYDTNQMLVGTSIPFVIPSNAWVNVPLPNIPFAEGFWAMVRWQGTPGNTHAIGWHTLSDGLFLDWFFDEDANRPFYWNNGRQQGVFMIRVNANRFDGSKETSTPITYAPEWTKVRSASFTDITNYAETETKTTAEVELVRSAGSKGLVVAPECPEPPQKAPFTFTGDYQLWRFTQGQPQANWYLINNNHTTESYTDNAWSDLPSGVYRYAVTARYAGGLLSQPSISNSLALNMEFDFRINISSNSEKPVTGAIVTLTSQELNSNGSAPLNTYRVVSGADGVTIPKAWVGVYDLTVTFGGHVNYSAQNININGPGLSHTAQLIEIIVNPMALEVDVNWPARSALLMWNRFEGFFDDMEDHADFARDNAIGDYTVYNFNPTQTYGLNTSWPGIYEPQAYMVWNPWGIGSMGWTLAGETDFFNPRPNGGGRKALASFGPVDYGRKDYWLVLPRVRTTHGVKFSFWARNVYPGSCTETLRIMISTTGKQVNDFQRLPGTTDVVIAEPWTKYSFDIPEEFARKDVYLAIQNMSTCGVLLLLDDISVDIDRGTSSKSVQNYTVYLNGNEVTTTANTEHLFSGLAEGTHTAGVKANYASGVSQTTTITFRMDENTNIAVLSEEIFTVYPNPVTDVLHIQTNEIITQIVVLDVNGRVMQTLQGNQKSVNLQALPVGNYIVRIHTATSVTPVKIVKQ